MILCIPVTKHEIVGTIIIIVAAIVIMLDPYAKRIGEEPNIIADVIALQASIPFALYFKFTALLKKEM